MNIIQECELLANLGEQNKAILGKLANLESACQQRHNVVCLTSPRGNPSDTNLDNYAEVCCGEPVPGEEAGVKHRMKLTINGISRWLSFDGMQDLCNIVEAEVREACTNRKSDILLKDYMADWYERFEKPKLEPNTALGYESIMRVHIIPFIGHKRVSDITVHDIQTVMNNLKSASRAKNAKCILNMVMEAAIADELYHHPNPTRDPRLVTPTAKQERQPVSSEDIAKLTDLLPKLPANLACILALLMMTGARREEALAARWEDIDWDKQTIHLQRALRFEHNRPVVSAKMKTKAANRTVCIWAEYIPFLGDIKSEGYIINDEGEPLTQTQWRNRWTAILKYTREAGIADFTPHQLRHTYATIGANKGIPPKVLQAMLGHENIQTTMNIYAGFDFDKVCESSLSLGETYKDLTQKKLLRNCTDQQPTNP